MEDGPAAPGGVTDNQCYGNPVRILQRPSSHAALLESIGIPLLASVMLTACPMATEADIPLHPVVVGSKAVMY